MAGEAELCIGAHDARETSRSVPATLASSGISEVFDEIVGSARLGPVPPATHTLTVTATGGGSVTPDGTTTHDEDAEVTLTASWNDATHDFSWGGDCAGTTVSTCALTMDANKDVTATFTELPATRCATPTDADCVLAVYRGAPGDYTQAVDIPADVLLTAAADGRYRVERGQQYTVVTAAPLPEGWTRFWLDWSPLEFGTPSPVSASQLIQPVGRTYTFTVTDDEAASTLITFDLKQARPFVRPRPDGKPEIGDIVVTTVFSVETSSPRYSSYDSTGAVATAGSYAFLDDPADTASAVTTYEALRDGTTTALLIHKSDAHGASQAALYDAVATGDLFEWHEAEDCFVRYKVTEVKPDPAGTVPRKLLAVEWMTYAYTGCSGGIPGETAVTVRHDPPPVTSYSVTSPIRHGPFLLIPKGWTGATEEPTRVTYPQSAARATWNRPAGWTGSLAEIQQHPLWSAPELPSGWAFDRANDFDGYLATEYVPAARNALIEIHVWRVDWAPIHEPYVDPRAGRIHEARLIDDYPAFLIYDPSNGSGLPVTVIIFKSDSGIIYEVTAHWALNTDYQSVIEIARSLYE